MFAYIKKQYRSFIEPRAKDQNIKRREVVFNYLLLGTFGLTAMALLTVTYDVLTKSAAYPVVPTVSMLSVFVVAILTIYRLARTDHYTAAALGLAGIYGLIALSTLAIWGLRDTQGAVLLAFFITMIGVLVSARASLFAALFSSLALVVLFALARAGIFRPNTVWLKRPSDFRDVIGLSIAFGVLALVAWLYNREMESALRRAERSEKALTRQKQLLEVTVEKRTRQLQAAQAQKMKQLYHFAELGHISTALLHDLSNHLALLTLDIESLAKVRSNRGAIVKQSQKSIQYIEELVQRVRYQLQGQPVIKAFNIVDEISEAMQLLAYKAKKTQVTLELTADQKRSGFQYFGDFVGFRQSIGNVLTNSIEAYEADDNAKKQRERHVHVEVLHTDEHFIITVTDRGKGIKSGILNKIFEPFYSTRQSGMGIGLFIARQLVEDQFKGRLTVASKAGTGTTFTIQLPRKPK